MVVWILVILGLGILIAGAFALAGRSSAARAQEQRRAKFMKGIVRADSRPQQPSAQPDSTPVIGAGKGEKLPFLPLTPIFEKPAQEPEAAEQPAADDIPAASIEPESPSEKPRFTVRLVDTPEGKMVLTTPPFALRESLFTRRAGRYINALSRRLPPWVVICPRVRLDSLVTPTAPDGRDAADWRAWRKRVRLRSIDAVLCDRRDFKPLLALMFERHGGQSARALGGGQDRMIDEVLSAAGLPLIRGSGEFHEDWPLIAPYVEQAILPTRDPLVEGDGEATRPDEAERPSSDGVVNLLMMDESEGGRLS